MSAYLEYQRPSEMGAAYAAFESRWDEDLEGIDDIYERAVIYGHVIDGIDIDLAKAMARSELHRSDGQVS